MKYLFLLLFPFVCNAQLPNPEISNNEVKTFVSVWSKTKTSQSSHDQKIIALLTEHKISQNRYGDILKSRINNKPVTLSDNEKAAIKQIEIINSEIKSEKESTLIALCKSYGISLERYSYILEKWQNDPDLKLQIQSYLNKLAEAK